MKSVVAVMTLLGALALAPLDARADGTCTPGPKAPPIAGTPAVAPATAPPASDESPVARARDLLARARLLDEAATADDRSAAEITARLPALRATAKAARARADRAAGDDREALVSRAEDLEADVAVSEAETTSKRRSAVDNRRVARELRARAVRLVREAPADRPIAASPCDPPYRFAADGRKLYRVECL
ncbi:MAG: hypothetical protein KF764_30860 [Labilithrix sp.]|nr:hypothetical protein [Labilithrix sp.]